MQKVKIERNREDLKRLDKLGEDALKSPRMMDLIVNGATLMSVNKDTLRGIIRVILTGAAAEIHRLQTCRDGCKADCIRNKKLLDMACQRLYSEIGCPAKGQDGPSWPECDGEAERCGDARETFECWEKFFAEKLQEVHDG